MPEVMQRRLIMLFCMRCSDVTVTLCDEELAFALRISDEELAATKALFLKKGFVNEAWEITNWDKRQYASDSSAERTRAYRERLKKAAENGETSQKRHGDALDTDTEKNIKPMSGKPDVLEVLNYLNQKAKREYRAVAANTKLIAARLGEGATVAECKAVIDAKVKDWLHDPKMAEYLRPETLFNATKFAQYVGKLGTLSVAASGGVVDARFKGAK